MAYDAFLQLKGIQGEATAQGMENAVDIYSFSWGVSNDVTVHGSGSSGGKAHAGALNVMKKTDKATPVLLKNCALGKHIDEVKLILRKQDGTEQQPFITVTMTGVFIASVQHSGSSGGDGTPTESVSLVYSTIDYGYSQQDKTGKLTTVASFKWDVSVNKVT